MEEKYTLGRIYYILMGCFMQSCIKRPKSVPVPKCPQKHIRYSNPSYQQPPPPYNFSQLVHKQANPDNFGSFFRRFASYFLSGYSELILSTRPPCLRTDGPIEIERQRDCSAFCRTERTRFGRFDAGSSIGMWFDHRLAL
jgi:hypothetical protein